MLYKISVLKNSQVWQKNNCIEDFLQDANLQLYQKIPAKLSLYELYKIFKNILSIVHYFSGRLLLYHIRWGLTKDIAYFVINVQYQYKGLHEPAQKTESTEKKF